MLITYVSPFDFAKPEAFVMLEPEACAFFSLYPEADQGDKTKRPTEVGNQTKGSGVPKECIAPTMCRGEELRRTGRVSPQKEEALSRDAMAREQSFTSLLEAPHGGRVKWSEVVQGDVRD